MFRRIQPPLKKEEVVFPVNLEKLGLFINDQDQLRQIEAPDKCFNYYYHKVERVNERRRESVDECLRRIIKERLLGSGLHIVNLPLTEKVETGRHVPIYLSDDMESNKKRLLVIVPNTQDDLGVWAVREMEGPGLNAGSMVSTVKLARDAGFSVAILNCGQHIWSPEQNRAVTYLSWKAATKASPHIDEVKNRVPGSETAEKHVRYVFDEVLKKKVSKETGIYVLCSGFGSAAVIKYLNTEYAYWQDQLQTVVVVESAHTKGDIQSAPLATFMRQRCRSYIVHAEPRGSYVPDTRFGCATFSSQVLFGECIVPQVQDKIFEYFKEVEEHPDTCNPQISENLMETMETFLCSNTSSDGEDEWASLAPEPQPWDGDRIVEVDDQQNVIDITDVDKEQA